eukprot:scaffold7704_cov417-Prasinococcus_capsulatus_cf.AAC.1
MGYLCIHSSAASSTGDEAHTHLSSTRRVRGHPAHAAEATERACAGRKRSGPRFRPRETGALRSFQRGHVQAQNTGCDLVLVLV